MEHITDKAAMRAWSRERQAKGLRIGFVPTMGSLHAGHLALVELAAQHADEVVVSIYVNPTQFDRRDDFERYPRTVSADQSALSKTPCKAVFAPTDLYNPDHMTWVEVPALAAHLCGAYRPGRFRGVATIVAKFFLRSSSPMRGGLRATRTTSSGGSSSAWCPTSTCLLTIIHRPTSREPDGLAMSSRNTRLTAEWRAAAASIPKALFEARDLARVVAVAERRVGRARRLRCSTRSRSRVGSSTTSRSPTTRRSRRWSTTLGRSLRGDRPRGLLRRCSPHRQRAPGLRSSAGSVSGQATRIGPGEAAGPGGLALPAHERAVARGGPHVSTRCAARHQNACTGPSEVLASGAAGILMVTRARRRGAPL